MHNTWVFPYLALAPHPEKLSCSDDPICNLMRLGGGDFSSLNNAIILIKVMIIILFTVGLVMAFGAISHKISFREPREVNFKVALCSCC